MAAVTTAFQWHNVVLMFGILFIALGLVRRRPDVWGLLVPPVLWASYGVVFYALLLSGQLSQDAVLLWGAIHRTFAGLMVIGGLVALWIVLVEPPEGGGEDD